MRVGGVALIRTSLQLLWHFHSASSLGGPFIKEKTPLHGHALFTTQVSV